MASQISSRAQPAAARYTVETVYEYVDGPSSISDGHRLTKATYGACRRSDLRACLPATGHGLGETLPGALTLGLIAAGHSIRSGQSLPLHQRLSAQPWSDGALARDARRASLPVRLDRHAAAPSFHLPGLSPRGLCHALCWPARQGTFPARPTPHWTQLSYILLHTRAHLEIGLGRRDGPLETPVRVGVGCLFFQPPSLARCYNTSVPASVPALADTLYHLCT